MILYCLLLCCIIIYCIVLYVYVVVRVSVSGSRTAVGRRR
jgi:hypothetical protein